MGNRIGVCELDGCNKVGPLTKGMCMMHYARLRRLGSVGSARELQCPRGSSLKEVLEYWGWDNDPETGCWIARGYQKDDGYVVYQRDGKKISAHRASFQVAHGAIPPGSEVRHKCDNPPCINPDHLEAGTHSDNMLDRSKRGRSPRNVLTPELVRRIRTAYDEGVRVKDISLEIGVSRGVVRSVKRGLSWTWVV